MIGEARRERVGAEHEVRQGPEFFGPIVCILERVEVSPGARKVAELERRLTGTRERGLIVRIQCAGPASK